MIFRNKRLLFIFILFFLFFSLRLVFSLQGRFVFSWDSARDALWVRQLTMQRKPILVGPWGSLDGAFFGPFFYYMLAGVFFIFGSDPRIAVGTVSLFISLMIVISYLFGKRVLDKEAGVIFGLFFAFLASFTQLSLFSFSQNLVPFFSLIFFISQWELIKKPTIKNIFFACLLASLFFHFEPINFPAAAIITMGIILYLWKNRKINRLFFAVFIGGIGFILPLIPNVIFDVRHDFIQLNAYWRFFSGSDKSLHGWLPPLTRLIDRPKQFFWIFLTTFFGKYLSAGKVVVLAFVIIFVQKRKEILSAFKSNRKYHLFFNLVLWNIGVLFIYFLLFSRLLKDYYLYMLYVLYVLAIGSLLALILKKKIIDKNILAFLFILIFVINIYALVKIGYLEQERQMYSTQKSIVETIYQLAERRPFMAYTYTTSIYDYPYQYLFSWYGNKKYGYIPVDYAYLPYRPDYVLNKKYFDKGKSTNSEKHKFVNDIFLVVEPGDHPAYGKEEWFYNFPMENMIYKKEFPGEITLIRLEIQKK